ncbi:MAG: AMP-binding protein [Hyphomicrobiaceae bacterium]
MEELPIPQRTFPHVLAEKASRNGAKPFILFEDRSCSYQDFDAITNRVANGFTKHGVQSGEHVAFLLTNCPEILFIYCGLFKMGGVAVPVNVAAKGELLVYFLEQSDATLLVADAALVDRFLEVQDRLPRIRGLVVLADDTEAAPDLVKRAGARSRVPVYDYHELEQGSPEAPDGSTRFCDVGYLSYTSGTTGPSKGSMATHAHAITQGIDQVRAYGYRDDDILYTCLPLSHGNAFLCCFMPALMADATIAIGRRFSARNFWDDVRRYKATQFNLLGAMANILWSQPEHEADRENSVRQCMAVPVPTSFYEGFEKRFGLTLTSLYGLTDFGLLTYRGPEALPAKRESGGPVRPEIEVRIVDDDDLPLETGQVGEITVRARDPWFSPLGYYNMKDETLEAWRNLWFHTGDRGFLDDDGWITFVDRKKDAIRRRGQNISSFEVEQMILRHPAIEDVAAFPVTSEMSEDEVMVSVVVRPNFNLDAPTLIEHCQQNMAYYMVPRYVEFRSNLPRNASEKVMKYQLRDEAEARRNELWDRENEGIVIRR